MSRASLPAEAKKAVDVFYIYPTVTVSDGGSVVISDIGNPAMQGGTYDATDTG